MILAWKHSMGLRRILMECRRSFPPLEQRAVTQWCALVPYRIEHQARTESETDFAEAEIPQGSQSRDSIGEVNLNLRFLVDEPFHHETTI